MHEDTMLTERDRAYDLRRVERLFVLLIVSISLSSPTMLERVRLAFPTRMQIAHIPAPASQHHPKSSPWTARRRSCRLPMKAKALDNGSPGRTGALIERRSRNFVRKGTQTSSTMPCPCARRSEKRPKMEAFRTARNENGTQIGPKSSKISRQSVTKRDKLHAKPKRFARNAIQLIFARFADC